jgi:hypothetical protein
VRAGSAQQQQAAAILEIHGYENLPAMIRGKQRQCGPLTRMLPWVLLLPVRGTQIRWNAEREAAWRLNVDAVKDAGLRGLWRTRGTGILEYDPSVIGERERRCVLMRIEFRVGCQMILDKDAQSRFFTGVGQRLVVAVPGFIGFCLCCSKRLIRSRTAMNSPKRAN